MNELTLREIRLKLGMTMDEMAEIYRSRKQEIELLPRDDNIIFMQSTWLTTGCS